MSETPSIGEHFFDAAAALECKLVLLKHDFETKSRKVEDIEDDPDERVRKIDERDRWHAHQSILFTLEFIDSFPPWREAKLGLGLKRLLFSLTNIQGGGKERWLENSVSGKQPIAIQLLAARGRCAGHMEVLMRDRSRKAAAEFIMTHLKQPALRALAGPRVTREVKWTTVARWRDRVTGKADDGPELWAYQAQIESPINWTEAIITRRLHQLREFLKEQGFR